MRGPVLALAVALAWLGAGCTTPFDLEAARDWLQREEAPDLPELRAAEGVRLPTPQELRATSGQLREIPLRWDPVLEESVGGYVLERSAEREGPFERIAVLPGPMETVHVDRKPVEDGSQSRSAGLPDGETRFYRVRAFNRGGELAGASEVVAATTAPPPDPPLGLRAWSHRPRRVPVGWEPSEDAHAAGYVVERSPTPAGPFEVVATIDDPWKTNWSDDGLGDLRVFYYRVSVRNQAGAIGEPAGPVRAVTKPEPLPPIGLRVVEQGLGENHLEWDPNVEPNLVGYRLLRRRGSGTRETVALLSPETTRATDAGVLPREQVSYEVVALDRDGLESAPSRAVEVQSEGYNLTATLESDGVHLAWTPRDDQGYTRARVFAEEWLSRRDLALVEGSTWVHARAQPGQSYRYRVVLEGDGRAPAPPSSVVEVRIPERGAVGEE